jgi:microcystin-dependent protein
MAVLTPNMGLLQPTIAVDTGLTWEQDVNANSMVLDGHNHSPGNGVQIPPSGLNINGPLTFQNQQAIALQAAVFTEQASLSTINALFVGTDGNLYFNDGASDPSIQITSGGRVNATSSGISSGTATASFVSSVLVVNAATNTPANIQAGSILIGNNISASNFVTLSAVDPLPSNYSLVLPEIPAATSFLTLDTSGNITAGTYPVMNGIAFAQLAAAVQQALSPSGSITAFGGTTAPSGWLICNGAAVSRTTFSNLFTAIGTNYGSGDGSTTFNIPDLQGQFLRGVSNASGRDPDATSRTAMNTGGNAGNNVGSVQSYQIQSHSHTYQSGGTLNVNGTFAAQSTTNSQANSGNPTGGNETRPINAYVNFIIKT